MRFLLLILTLFYAVSATATDLSHIYSDQTLRYWQNRYKPHLEWNFNNLVLGSLTPDEKQRLGTVRLELPLRGPGESAGELLNFFANGKRIVMPIQSIRFFDDLSQAWGYAWSNSLNLENITSYLAILKYQKPPPGGFPPPLKALGIPENAWKSDKKMDDVSQKILKSAMVFIMAHELAHILYQHPGSGSHVSAKQAQANELQADRFANEIMRRIGVAPGGMVEMFMAFAHYSPTRGDFSSDKAWDKFLKTSATHPVTSVRLRSMAADLKRSPANFSVAETDRQAGSKRVLYIASQIEGIADILDDLKMQRFISGKGRGLSLASLNYHSKPKPSVADSRPFSGDFGGTFLHRTMDGNTEKLAMTASLQRRGKQVTGSFDFGFGTGRLEGIIIAAKLHFQWVLGDAFGQGVLSQRATEHTLNGRLGYAKSDSNGGEWHLKQR